MRNAVIAIVVLLLAAVAHAKDNPKKAPKNARGDGKVYAWQAKDGLEYEYCVPRSYDPEKGATLLVSFHGSNLSKGWTFWNHEAGEFCGDRIVVSPDGTTPNGKGGFNFLDGAKDLARAKALIEEIRETFKVTGTYLYGHSQGSFFIQHLVGAYPDLADGICAHASRYAWSMRLRPIRPLLLGRPEASISRGVSTALAASTKMRARTACVVWAPEEGSS